jgi:hypothetical protein
MRSHIGIDNLQLICCWQKLIALASDLLKKSPEKPCLGILAVHPLVPGQVCIQAGEYLISRITLYLRAFLCPAQ